MYNFVKTCNDANFREFHNPNFQRDRPELMANIKRKASQPANASVALEKKPDVQNMTQRQKAMLEQQERENERLEQAKQRRAASERETPPEAMQSKFLSICRLLQHRLQLKLHPNTQVNSTSPLREHLGPGLGPGESHGTRIWASGVLTY